MQKYKAFTLCFPDCEEFQDLVNDVAEEDDVVLTHESGMPWLLIRNPFEGMIHHIDTPFPLALVGSTDAPASTMKDLARRVHGVAELPLFSREITGSFNVFASYDGRNYANSPALQSKKVFHAEVHGKTVISDRADVLADLAEFPLNRTAVGLRLMRGIPHPADSIPLWEGITELPGKDFLVVNREGTACRQSQWWRKPEATLSRAEGARALRQAVERAVQVRANNHLKVACDLSGGLDSTPVCYFAAKHSSHLVAQTYYTDDPGGREDLDWSYRAIPDMPRPVDHQIFSNEGLPGFFGELNDLGIPFDEPTSAAATFPRLKYMLNRDRDSGITLHLNGIGGDHLLRGVKTWNHTISRYKPLTGWNRARQEDIPDGIGRKETLRELLDRRTYTEWFTEALNKAFSDDPQDELPRTSDWSVPMAAPVWFTDAARDEVKAALQELIPDLTPFDHSLAGHFDIQTIKHATALTRGMEQAGQALGVSYEAPLLDDHVVEAALATRYEERDSPVEWKPLMKEAMKGLLSDDYLRRTTKIGGGPQTVRGYADYYEELYDLWNSSGFFDLGLVDEVRLKRESQPSSVAAPPGFINPQNNVAIFLQARGKELSTAGTA